MTAFAMDASGKFSRLKSARVRLRLLMESPPFLPGEDQGKPKRVTVGVTPKTFEAMADIVRFYEDIRVLEGTEETYQWTMSRLIHKWIRATLVTLGEQMGIDIFDSKQRKERFAEELSKAKKELDRENGKKKR
jgi:hypothetical protein